MEFVNGLPESCYVVNSMTNEVVMVKRGEIGFYGTREGNEPWYGQETADSLNEGLGVTKGQAEAMKIGSLFGWNIPGARPEMYFPDTGRPIGASTSASQGRPRVR